MSIFSATRELQKRQGTLSNKSDTNMREISSRDILIFQRSRKSHSVTNGSNRLKAKAGLRHTVVCSNVTGRIKYSTVEERIARIKRARAGSLAIID